MDSLTPELADLYTRWLLKIPPECSPHFYNLSHHHKIVILLDRPLARKPTAARTDVRAYVQNCRKILVGWLGEGKKYQFSCDMARTLSPICRTELWDPQNLIDHLYFTDLVKCAGSEGPHGQHNQNFLRDEFRLLTEATLFIILGREAWEGVPRLFGSSLKCVPWKYQHLSVRPTIDSNITEVHGVLFEDSKSGRFVIPLAFPGSNSNPLRDSYFEYFRDGLAALNGLCVSKA